MYSLVLMSAMSTAPATPEFNGFFRDMFFGCNGCNGCYGGGARYGCGGCGGCDGFLGFGLLSRRPFFDRGCYGCGGGGAASYAPSYGCGAASYAPSYGGCYGSASYSCYGSAPAVSYSAGCYGAALPGGTTIPAIPYAPVEPAPASTSNLLMQAGHVAAAAPQGTRATVVVKLPATARLYADGKLLALTSAERKFVTPPLPEGEFAYRFKVEYDRDGETYSATQKVLVKPGKTVTVEFAEQTSSVGGIKASVTTTAEPPAAPPTTVAPAVVPPAAPTGEKTDRATITVKLPPGATLYVDDKKNSTGEPVRQFTTPPIPAGKEYAYNMKAEVIRDGRPETITQKVSFKAGDKLVVDLTAGK